MNFFFPNSQLLNLFRFRMRKRLNKAPDITILFPKSVSFYLPQTPRFLFYFLPKSNLHALKNHFPARQRNRKILRDVFQTVNFCGLSAFPPRLRAQGNTRTPEKKKPLENCNTFVFNENRQP